MGLALSVLDEFRGVEPSTRLSEVVLRPVTGDGTLMLSFSLLGGLRDVFGPEAWERAYSVNDMMLVLHLTIEVRRKGPLGGRTVLGPLRLRKEARLYWSRDPARTGRVWALIVDEDERTFVPSSPEEARQLMFDFERELRPSLRSGRNEVWAEVEVSWGRHAYVEKGKRRGRSATAVVEVPRAPQGRPAEAGAVRLRGQGVPVAAHGGPDDSHGGQRQGGDPALEGLRGAGKAGG
ncbi:MAG: hypothetical protein ACP5LG_02335 [Conexivisphaera sp.]